MYNTYKQSTIICYSVHLSSASWLYMTQLPLHVPQLPPSSQYSRPCENNCSMTDWQSFPRTWNKWFCSLDYFTVLQVARLYSIEWQDGLMNWKGFGSKWPWHNKHNNLVFAWKNFDLNSQCVWAEIWTKSHLNTRWEHCHTTACSSKQKYLMKLNTVKNLRNAPQFKFFPHLILNFNDSRSIIQALNFLQL